jgi:c-di-GMP phosphodiesterase
MTMTDSRNDSEALDIYIARQPILDQRLGVIGYELLYRHANTEHARIDDEDLASSAVILGSFMHIGIDTLVGSALAFVNLSRRFIVDESLLPFFEGQVVLEIREDLEPDEQLLAGLRRLKKLGHQVSLDDFTDRPNRQPLLELADYVKLDVLTQDPARLRKLLGMLRSHAVGVVAKNVETQELHERCQALGFDYFQGFFYCRPKTVAQHGMPPNQAVVLRLIQQLEDPDSDVRDLERVLAQEVTMTYKLLRYVNSAAFARRREIDSLRDAITLIGIDRIRNWAYLILMGQVANGKPSALIVTCMIRARMCERLAERFHPEIRHQMFVVGLFSLIDALMDSDMPTLLDNLGLSLPIKLALLEGEGIQGALLRQVIEYEQGRWEGLADSQIPRDDYLRAYLEALQWSNETMGIVSETGVRTGASEY